MQFEENLLYHIYNQGNNRERLFYSPENFKYFKWKMKAHLIPFGDLAAYCLMDNHYHFLFWVKKVAVPRSELRVHMDNIEIQRRKEKYGANALPLSGTSKRIAKPDSLIDLNNSIGIMQKSYTQAINKERSRTGGLFRKPYHSKNGYHEALATMTDAQFRKYQFGHGNDYEYVCFNYIHNNPVKARIVKNAEDYRWSSARDYFNNVGDSLCNLELGNRIVNLL